MSKFKDAAKGVVNVLKAEPVRLRLYSAVVLVVGYLVARGYIDHLNAEFLMSMAGLVLAVETARAKVTPMSKVTRVVVRKKSK